MDEFEKWWEDHGQYCRTGGGQYEKTFAFRAWEACAAQFRWQNIEEAPKDGTWIIGRDGLDIRLCSWEDGPDTPVAQYLGYKGSWHRRPIYSGKSLMGGEFHPKHWMVLPPEESN